MHIFIFIHFQSPAHVGDLTIQHSIREKNIFDILLYNGIRKYCALVVELNIWRPSMRFMNWTYSQWILNQYQICLDLMATHPYSSICFGCIYWRGRWNWCQQILIESTVDLTVDVRDPPLTKKCASKMVASSLTAKCNNIYFILLQSCASIRDFLCQIMTHFLWQWFQYFDNAVQFTASILRHLLNKSPPRIIRFKGVHSVSPLLCQYSIANTHFYVRVEWKKLYVWFSLAIM